MKDVKCKFQISQFVCITNCTVQNVFCVLD